jgi:hypothetical protein
MEKDMGKYILLGMHQPDSSKNNLRIIRTTDDYEQLVGIWETIEKFYSQLEKDGQDGVNAASRKMMEEYPYLRSLCEVYFESIIFTVTIIGIFETLKVGSMEMIELT